MRVLLDENLDWRLRRGFDTAHDVVTVQYRGWSGKTNGALLRAAAAEFDVFVTLDSNLEHQQNVASLDLAVLVVRAASSDLADVEPALPALNALLPSVQPGRVMSSRPDPLADALRQRDAEDYQPQVWPSFCSSSHVWSGAK